MLEARAPQKVLPVAMLVLVLRMVVQQQIIAVPLVGKDFISRTMEAQMYARHTRSVLALLVNITPPALLQRIPHARHALITNIPAVALQQSVLPRPDPLLAPLAKDLPMEVPLQTTAVLYAPLEPQSLETMQMHASSVL